MPLTVFVRRVLAGLVLLGGSAGPVLAWEGAGEQSPATTRPDLPSFLPPARPLGPPPAAVPPAPLSSGKRVTLREIRLAGNTVFTVEDLAPVVAPYLGRALETEDLLGLRRDVTRFYVDRGYINSGAVLPDQQVVDGVLTLLIVEGRLSEVEVESDGVLCPAYLASRILGGGDEVLDVARTQQRLRMLLLKLPVTSIDAALLPGAEPGTSRLKVRVEESVPVWASASVANDLPDAVGTVRKTVSGGVRSLFGLGDAAAVKRSHASGYEEISGSYALPLWSSGITAGVRGNRVKSRIVDGSLSSLDVRSATWALEGGLAYTLVEVPEREAAFGVELHSRTEEDYLLGFPFSFSAGPRDGRTRTVALALPLDLVFRGETHAVALRSTLLFGTLWFGATANTGGLPDSRAVRWQGQGQAAFRLDPDGRQILARLDIQLADRPLIALDKMAVGGAATVRGYRENEVLRDRVIISSLEYRHPLIAGALAADQDSAWRDTLALALFVDAADARDRRSGTSAQMASVGAGLVWTLGRHLDSQIHWARRLRDADASAGLENRSRDSLHWTVRVGF